MSDGSLSQDEIDALLSGSDGMDTGGADAPADGGESAAGLGSGEQQAFMSLLSGFKESQQSNLSSMIGKSVTVGEPSLDVISNGTFVSSLPPEVVQIASDFTGGVSGKHSFLFAPEIATTIAGLMMGQEDVELNEAALSALEEAGNTIAGAEATSVSDQIGTDVSTAPGRTTTVAAGDVEVPEGEFLKAVFPVMVEGESPSEIIEIFDLGMARQLIAGMGGAADAGGGDVGLDALLGSEGGAGDASAAGGGQSEQSTGFPMAGQNQPNVQSVQFPSFSGGGSSGDQGNISLLMDVYMEMTVELGRTRKTIRDILGMGEGTIIELDKLAGEPVDILVNHKLIAKGEVVVIDENFGVRVTDIVDPMERVAEI